MKNEAVLHLQGGFFLLLLYLHRALRKRSQRISLVRSAAEKQDSSEERDPRLCWGYAQKDDSPTKGLIFFVLQTKHLSPCCPS
jgi:hypothetical protein